MRKGAVQGYQKYKPCLKQTDFETEICYNLCPAGIEVQVLSESLRTVNNKLDHRNEHKKVKKTKANRQQ